MNGYPALKNELSPDDLPDDLPDESGVPGGSPPEEAENQNLTDFGQLSLPHIQSEIHVVTVIGQVEGHLVMPPQNKATKYEHLIPQLVAVEECPEIKGLLVILNTVGGDVEAGLALAEMIAGMSKPTASLVLGGGHSIGVPIAVSADRSFIASTATMTIHPIRLTGMVLGVQQSFDYLERMQERVINFVTDHSSIRAAEFKRMMMTTGELARDVGTVVVGKSAVNCGLIDEVGGLAAALHYLRSRFSAEAVEKESTAAVRKPQFSTRASRSSLRRGRGGETE